MINVTVNIEKKHKVLAKFIEKVKSELELRPSLGRVCVDAERGYLVASDGRVIAAMKADIKLNKKDDDLKNVVTMDKSLCEKPGYVEVESDDTLKVYSKRANKVDMHEDLKDSSRKFPNWQTVFPSLSEDYHLRITAEGRKRFADFMKEVKEIDRNTEGGCKFHRLKFFYQSYDREILVTFDNVDVENGHREVRLPLEEYRTESFHFSMAMELIMKMSTQWNGSFWFVRPDRCIVFDSDSQDTFAIMPLADENAPVFKPNPHVKFDIPWDKRYGESEAVKPATKPASQPEANVKQEAKAQPDAEVKSEDDVQAEYEQPEDEQPTDITTYSGGVTVKRSRCIVGSHFFPLLEVRGDDGAETLVAGTSLFRCISDKDGEIRPEYAELFRSIDAFVDDHLLIADPLDEEAICRQVNQFIDMMEDAAKDLDKHNIKAN